MRIVYDDTMQAQMIEALANFMNHLDVQALVSYEYGMDRVQSHILRKKLNSFFEQHKMSIGNTVTHAYGIGNNCQHPVYYHPEDENELQQCGSININRGMFGEVYVNCVDYNDRRISPRYEIRTPWGVKKEA